MRSFSFFALSPFYSRALAVIGLGAAGALCAEPVSSVTLNGQTFINQGLVGVGRLPASLKDKFGETFGSFSGFTFDQKTWQRTASGGYTGMLYTQPDRGYNGAGTTNWTPRYNKIAITFAPAAAGASAQNQVGLTLVDSIKFTEADGTPFTALDATSAGTGARPGFPALPQGYNGRLSLDAEGIILNPDGSLWISDEYGPYVFKFSADGKLLAVIRPPDAIIPKRNGVDSFASNNPAVGQPIPVPADPTTGRQNNQGLEGLSLSPDGKTLFALLQSATRQDGGTSGTVATRNNTRLFAYDLTSGTPVLRGEYVVQLPTYVQSGSTRVAAQSDLLAINNTQFLVITRDSGNGHGFVTPTSLYRTICVYDIASATNIAGTAYDTATTPIAPAGVLAAGITPATRAVLIDVNDPTQLAKFGLHNGPTDDTNNLSEKWEALTLVPALDPAAPNDWFLFVGNDNDFITQNGFQDGAAYADASGVENDSVVLVYRLTLPTRVVNFSSRAQTGAGAGTHILGFVVSGPKPKTFLVRGTGPALTNLGLTGALPNPTLALFNSAGQQLLANDDWGSAANLDDLRLTTTRVGAFTLPEGSKDSALLAVLDPGAYTVQVTDASGATGISLIEVFEAP